MSKIIKGFIGVGHGGSDPGAVANGLRESDVNLAIALACRDELERYGIQILLSRAKDENDTLNEEIKECNNYKPDFAVEIHNNSGGGDGFEIFYHYKGGKSLDMAKAIENKVIDLGQNSRGCKTRLNSSGTDYYGFIRQTVCPAVIAECAFLDSNDRFIIDEAHEQKAFGIAIAHGVLNYLGINIKGPAKDEVNSNNQKTGEG